MGTGKGHLRDSEVSSWVIWWCYLLRWGFQKELFLGGGTMPLVWDNHSVIVCGTTTGCQALRYILCFQTNLEPLTC